MPVAFRGNRSVMAKNKGYLVEFDPVIYPRLLWVVKGGAFEEIQATFKPVSEERELEITYTNFGAWECPVERKCDACLGVVVWFPRKMKVGDMAHEATHAALDIFGDLGIDADRDNNEHLAYFIGWIVDCIDKVRKTKRTNDAGLDGKQQ